MKNIIYFLIISLLTFHIVYAGGDSINQDWYSKAIDNIKKQEYYITYSEELNSYQSPNRKNNLRFTYKINGFTVVPRVTETYTFNENNPTSERKKIKVSDDWKAEFTLLGYGRNGMLESRFLGKEIIVKKNRASIEDSKMKIDYVNNEEGMRQNFTIYSKPENEKGLLTLLLEVKTKENILVGADVLVIKNKDAEEYMKYNSLKIWDANGKELRGWFKSVKNNVNEETKKIQIVVNDEKAIYPIIIDPLSTNASWTKSGSQTDSRFGFAVATAGDVNGDDFSDVIISAPYYDNSGRVYVFHGSSTGLPFLSDWDVTGTQQNSEFGYSVSTAGDINGDGYSDIIIGIPNYDDTIPTHVLGRFVIYYGSANGLSNTEGGSFNAGLYEKNLGYSVSTAGDVNGDGYSDIVVSAPYYSVGLTERGKIFVFYGSQNGLDLSSYWFSDSDQAYAHFGNQVSTSGDFNGDGFSDIIVGAQDYDGITLNDAGRIYIYFGSDTGMYFSSYTFLEGNEADGKLGKSVSTAGDVNGDGYSDVIVGRNSTIDAVYRGIAEVYYGSNNGTLNTTPDWSAYLNNSIIVDGFADAVSTAGDVDGDGFADVIIGAQSYYKDGESIGAAFLYNGSSNGLDTSYSWMVEGTQDLGLFGSSVGIAGDVNGDGYSDIIVGENKYQSLGKAYVYYGNYKGMLDESPEELYGTQIGSNFGTSVSTAGDVNGDGFSDIIIGVPDYDNGQQFEGAAFLYYGTNGTISQNDVVIIEGNQEDAKFGTSVSTAGDVNGDGYDDIIIGMPGKIIGQDKVGAAYVYQGSNTGLIITPLKNIYGDQHNSNFGSSVSTAGDVNGDGFADIIIGAELYNSLQGKVFVYHGSSTGFPNTESWSVVGNLTGNLGNSVATAGDVNGDGYSDIIIGASGSTNGESGEGKVFVYHGSAAGLSLVEDWSIEGNQNYVSLGVAVSTAGDINGDGFSDVVVSSNNSSNKEGAVFVYHGSASGLSLSSNWSVSGIKTNGYFGGSVSTGGDVNGDGYSDLIIGEKGYYEINPPRTGKAYLYKGSVNGLSSSAIWTSVGGNDFEYGISVSTAGDVNGDGYSDILIGAPGYNGVTIHGGTYLYYGNSRTSLDSRIRQKNPTTSNIIAAGNLTESNGSVELGVRVKSPFGRADGRFVYEFRKYGETFSSGDSINNSVSFDGAAAFEDLNTNPNGKVIVTNVSGLQSSYSDAYQWRARKEFSLVNNPYQKYGPWKYYSAFSPIQPYAFRPRVFIPLNIIAQIKVLLEGPYDAANNNMFTNNNGNIPTTSPYQDSRTASSIPANAVDWIYVELRDKNDETKILAGKSGFLLQNKTIRDTDGSSALGFTLPEDDYYIVVKHRNHLSIMSANPVYLTAN